MLRVLQWPLIQINFYIVKDAYWNTGFMLKFLKQSSKDSSIFFVPVMYQTIHYNNIIHLEEPTFKDEHIIHLFQSGKKKGIQYYIRILNIQKDVGSNLRQGESKLHMAAFTLGKALIDPLIDWLINCSLLYANTTLQAQTPFEKVSNVISRLQRHPFLNCIYSR